MGLVAAYCLVVAVALAAGAWSAVSFHRWNPNYRSAPAFRNPFTAVLKGLSTACVVLGLGLALAWLLGNWNSIYLTGFGVFIAVEFVSLTVWPIIRASR